MVKSGSVYVARNVTLLMLWMWGNEAGTNHPVRQCHIPKERRPLCVCVLVRVRVCARVQWIPVWENAGSCIGEVVTFMSACNSWNRASVTDSR